MVFFLLVIVTELGRVAGSKWPTIFAGKVVETQEVKALEASKEASKEIPAKSKGLRRLLGVVAAEFAVVAALLLK